jgi:hypothetical protein
MQNAEFGNLAGRADASWPVRLKADTSIVVVSTQRPASAGPVATIAIARRDI